MPTITDWLMVGITAVYVVATVFISCANIKSANATRDQLTESKRQYEDKKRLEIMPYEITEIRAEDRNRLVFHFKNGEEAVKRWKDRSRAESWTPEKREAARQKALERSRQNG